MEPQEQYSYDWTLSAMDIVRDSSLVEAHALTADSRRNRLGAIIHTMINEAIPEAGSISTPSSLLAVPSAFMSESVIESLVEGDPDLPKSLKIFLKTATTAYLLPNIPGHASQDFHPMPCDARSIPNIGTTISPQIQRYSWKSMEHASLGLSLLTAHLYGCNVAGNVFRKAKTILPVIDTTEYEEMTEKARQTIAMIVGSMSFLCSQADIDGVGGNDYMWLHNTVPFVVALQSPFVTTEQRILIKRLIRYIAEVKGIKMVTMILQDWQLFEQVSARA
jgi:hypothetical protein